MAGRHASLVQFVSVERAVDVPVVQHAGLRRTLDVIILMRSAASRFAIALRGGGTIDVLGIHVRATHALHADARADDAACWRAPRSPAGRGCRCRRERQPDRRVAHGRRRGAGDDAAAVAGALRARRPGAQRQRRHVAAALAQQPAPASISLGLSCCRTRTTRSGATPMQALLDRWTGRANAYPEAVGSLSLVGARGHAAAWWRVGWQAVADPRRRHGLLRAAGARPLRPRRRRQHADPDAVERAALRADPRAWCDRRAASPCW